MEFAAITWADGREILVAAVAVVGLLLAINSNRTSAEAVRIAQEALDIDKDVAAERRVARLNVTRGSGDTVVVSNGGPGPATDIQLTIASVRQGVLLDQTVPDLGPGEEWPTMFGYQMGQFTAQLSWLDGTDTRQEREVPI